MRDELLEPIILHTNFRLKSELPKLEEQKKVLEGELEKIKQMAENITQKWLEIAVPEGDVFIREKLATLGKRRAQIEEGLSALSLMIDEIETDVVEKEIVQKALQEFNQIFNEIKPYRQRELITEKSKLIKSG